jgi:phage N-6-adenine-methyltransferase
MSLVGFKASNHPQQVGKRGATERDNLGTDPALFAKLNERFHFTLDVAATPENAKCEDFYTAEDDGLSLIWHGRVWCNPPYSQIREWVWKAWREVHPPTPMAPGSEWCHWCDVSEYECRTQPRPELIVMLLPANRPEQAWWQELVEPYRDRPDSPLRTEFLRGRQRFVLPGAESIGPNERPPFGCVLLIWDRP